MFPNAHIRIPVLAAVLTALAVAVAIAATGGPADSAGAAPAAAPAKKSGSPVATASRRRFTIATRTFKMKRPNEKRRLVVRCPGNLIPLGGGMKTRPKLMPDGEGVYPHSYERLGVQRGWHVTPVLFDPSPKRTRTHRVTLQVVCTRKMGKMTPPHVIKNVKPGRVKTAIARCPGRRHLIGGGFQRTNWVKRGGNYATESRLISSKAWRVTGSAFGNFGGQLVSIGYCQRSKRPLLKTVSATIRIGHRRTGTVTTPRCPRKRRLVFGGFSSSHGRALHIASGTIRRSGAFTVSAFNRFGPSATLSAHGYCLKR
jgi:hypothetical protein